MKTKTYNDRYTITSLTKDVTSKGANYFNIMAVDNTTGEIVTCVYFGNTTPKRLLRIDEVGKDDEHIYRIGTIQPHTSRDKKTGRFIKGPRKATI